MAPRPGMIRIGRRAPAGHSLGRGPRRSSAWAAASLSAILLCGLAPPARAVSVTFTDAEGKPAADTVLSLTPETGAPGRAAAPAVMDQRDEAFLPKVLPVQVGADVAFRNFDKTRHQVYSFSPAKPFEREILVGAPPEHVVFDKPGVVALGCNIHDRMLAYVVVVEGPYFAKTNEGGVADLGALPAGAYRALVWNARLKGKAEVSSRVIIAADGITGLTTTLDLKPERRPPPEAERGAY